MEPSARRRLYLLLFVAALSGSVAGWVGSATASKQSLIVVTPPVHAVARSIRCPIPTNLRSAFEAAARDTGLPLAMLVAVAKVESNFY